MAAQVVQGFGHLAAFGGNPALQDLRPLLLVTTVDIGAGRSDRLEVRRGDDPAEVAAAFAAKHNLPTAVIPRLADHLQENVAKIEGLASARQSPEPGPAAEALQPGQSAPQEISEGGYEDLAVFNRLYEQALVLRRKLDSKRDKVKRSELEALKQNKASMSWISAEMMRERGSGPFSSYGEMLYQESLESLARKREKAERCKQEQARQEIAEASFRPEITRLAQKMWGPHQHGSVPAWQRLSKGKVTKAQQRLETLRREKQEAEMRECTFKPQLSEHSERLVVERSQAMRNPHLSAHQQLYQDALRRQQKQHEYQLWRPEEETFQPKLIESTLSKEFLRRSLQKEASSAQPGDQGMAVVDRLYASYEKLQSKLAEARSSLTKAVDPVTGKRLFHPETGRAPTTIIRHGDGHDICQNLYKLKQQQDEKVRAAAEALELKRQEVMTSSKASQGSKQLLKQLQQKRFKQIFEFLDQDGLGSFNLVSLIIQQPEWLNELDDEVRADLESAAKLLSKRSLKRNDSNKSDTSSASFFMPPPPAMSLASGDGQAGASASASGTSRPGSSAPASPSQPGVVTLTLFCALMAEALALRRGPRTYLAPSPPRKYVPPETYKPQIDERSKQLAAKKRPKDKPYFESLYAEGSAISQKLQEKRAEAEAQRVSACTFAPRLVSKQLVKEGTVMKRVREGTFYKPPGADMGDEMGNIIDDPDSLQQLAASVMGGQQGSHSSSRAPGGLNTAAATAAAAEAAQAASAEPISDEACTSKTTPGVEAEESVSHALHQLQLASEPSSSSSSSEEVARRLQHQRELEELDLRLQAALEEQRQVEAELRRHQQRQQLGPVPGEIDSAAQKQHQQQQQPGKQHAEGQGTKAGQPGRAEDDDEFEGSEEHRQYLELEREVQEMLEATSAAAAAAERLHSRTDQQYLSEILGLAQEQVDAMAPAISKLQALQLQHPHPASTTTSAAATPLASVAGALALQKHPLHVNTFQVTTAEAAAAADAEEPGDTAADPDSSNNSDTLQMAPQQYKQPAVEDHEEPPLVSDSTYLL